MRKTDHIMISLHQQHADNILNGTKTVELRRRYLNVAPGSSLWIYTKKPKGQIDIFAVIDDIVFDKTHIIWRMYGGKSGVSKEDYYCYFRGNDLACAIILKNIEKMESKISLNDIRRRSKDFHPPQFFKRLQEDSPELNLLQAARTS